MFIKSIRGRQDAAPREVSEYDRRGRRRPEVTMPGYKAGERPPNYGLKLPAEVLTPAEAGRLLAACGKRGPCALRNRAIIVVLWRAGLRTAEALGLELRDVDRDHGTLTVRHGKGNRRRVVGLDPSSFAVIEQWLEARRRLDVPRGAPLFCTVSQPNIGRPIGGGYWRECIKRLGERAGIEKRVHSHGLRHTCAVELMREGVPVLVISRQLGHSNLSITQRYLDHLEPAELVAVMKAREWPAPEPPTA